MADKYDIIIDKIKLVNKETEKLIKTENLLDSTLEDRVEILNKIQKKSDNISDMGNIQLDIEDKINEHLEKGEQALADKFNLEKKAVNVKLKELRTQTLANQKQKMMNSLTGGLNDKLKQGRGFMKGMGVAGTSAFVAMGLVAGAVALLVKSLKFASEITDALGKQFGVLGTAGGQFQKNLQRASVEVISLGKGTADVVSLVDTLSKDFGITLDRASKLPEQILDTAVAIGLSTDEAGKLFGTLISIGNLTSDQAENLIESTYQLAQQNNVNPSAVLRDMASNSELIAKFGAQNAESLAKAAIQAKKLGLNLSTVDRVSESLLDFQSSITKEIELSAILGRRVDFTRARIAANDGKSDEMMRSVTAQLRGQANLLRDNVLIRKAAAGALNMELSELMKIIEGQDKSIVQAKTFNDLLGRDGMSSLTSIVNKFKEIGATILLKLGQPVEQLLESFKKRFFTDENIARVEKFIHGFLDSMISLAGSVGKIFNLFGGIATLVGDIASILTGTALFSALGALVGLAFGPGGAAAGSVIGAKVGAVAFGTNALVNDFQSSGGSHLVVTPSGQALKTNPRDTVFGTTTPVNDFSSGPAGSMGMANKETNGLLNRIIEQNETLIAETKKSAGRIGDTVGGFVNA